MFRLKPTRRKEGVAVCRNILRHFGVKHTRRQVSTLLADHMDYPSLLSLHDVLAEYGIASTAIRKGDFSYEDVETPYIITIQQEDWPSACFTVVSCAESNLITYIDPVSEKAKTALMADFETIDKGVLLLLDGESTKDESNYLLNRRLERKDEVVRTLPFLLVGLSVLIPLVYLLSASGNEGTRWISLCFLATGLIGLAVSVLLLLYDIDAHNPFLKEVCAGKGKKASCESVLSSNGSDFLGVSWSIWGFSYFATFFLVQLLYPGQVSQLTFWSAVSLLASFYVPYSIYYQWRVVKQWCPLCVTVQVILLLNAIVSLGFIAGTPALHWEWYLTSMIVLSGVVFLVLNLFALPLFKQAKEGRNYAQKWRKLRYNSSVFYALLERSGEVTVSVEDVGIVVGNPSAKHEIIKVCNPYCSPCSKAHPELDQILKHNSNVRLRIVFTATGEESDIRTKPVAHLLAIQQVYGMEIVHRALNDWYLPEMKDYDVFAKKYPMNGELKQQQEKIRKMSQWCNDMKVRVTPTIYVDGKELPDTYSIYELKNVL